MVENLGISARTAHENVLLKVASLELWEPLSNLSTHFAALDLGAIHSQCNGYLRFGVAKRLAVVLHDVRWLTSVCAADRTEPLTDVECSQAGLHLNSFYMNLRGVLDNFAWAILWYSAPVDAAQIEKSRDFMKVGLFKGQILNKLSSQTNLKKLIESNHEWNADFSQRRDPVAHRLPLRVIPQVFTSESQSIEYQRLLTRYHQNINELAQSFSQQPNQEPFEPIDKILGRCALIQKKFETHRQEQQKLNRRIASIGIFYPAFTYSPKQDEIYPLYPTLTNDCSVILKIGSAFLNYVEFPPNLGN